MRFLFFYLILTQLSFAIPVGFNQAWFHNDYSHQYLDGVYDRNEVQRILQLTKEARAQTLRLWFFESPDFPMLVWDENKLIGVRADFIKNVIETLKMAKSHNLKIYMTFLDAHSYRPDKLNKKGLQRLRSIYQKAGAEEFLRRAIAPLLNEIKKEGLSEVISRIDITNEMDTVVNRYGFNEGWTGASRMLCQWSSFIKALDGYSSVPISFSLRIHRFLHLPQNILSDQGPMRCADFFDFHSYANSGKIYRCNDFKKHALSNKKPLILGEFGQNYFTSRYSDSLQLRNTKNYLHSAAECGFSEALAWRLSDIRPGGNKEARYSFEAYGQMRPAYEFIKDQNSNP